MIITSQVISISSYSGGGKTTVTNQLSVLLQDAVTVHFDDYEDCVLSPPMDAWPEQPDFNAWKIARLASDLRELKSGNQVFHPVSGKLILPENFIILDAAMARRLLRAYSWPDHPVQKDEGQYRTNHNEMLLHLKYYLEGARQAFLMMDKVVKPVADLIVNGDNAPETIAEEISRKFQLRVRPPDETVPSHDRH